MLSNVVFPEPFGPTCLPLFLQAIILFAVLFIFVAPCSSYLVLLYCLVNGSSTH